MRLSDHFSLRWQYDRETKYDLLLTFRAHSMIDCARSQETLEQRSGQRWHMFGKASCRRSQQAEPSSADHRPKRAATPEARPEPAGSCQRHAGRRRGAGISLRFWGNWRAGQDEGDNSYVIVIDWF
jgi:hypothetical protein